MSQVNVNLPAPLSRIPQFDARKVPVVAVDDGLPAIPAAAVRSAAPVRSLAATRAVPGRVCLTRLALTNISHSFDGSI